MVARIEKSVSDEEKNKTALRTAPHTELGVDDHVELGVGDHVELRDDDVNWKETYKGLRNLMLSTVWIAIIVIAIKL